MDADDKKERDFRDFMKMMSLGSPFDDEYNRIAERDAFFESYSRRNYLKSSRRNKHHRANNPQPDAAIVGVNYSDYAGCMASRRVLKSADDSTALFSADQVRSVAECQQGPVPPCLA